MKLTNRITSSLLVLTLASAFSVAVLAKDKCGHDFRGSDRMIEALELTDAQQAKFEAMKADHKADMRQNREAHKAEHEALRELALSGASEAEIRAKSDALALERSKDMTAHLLVMRDFHQSLSPEQQAKLAELKAQRDACRAERREMREAKKAARQQD